MHASAKFKGRAQKKTFRTAPEGPNYHLTAAKAGFRAEKRDNGGLGFHEAPVKFP